MNINMEMVSIYKIGQIWARCFEMQPYNWDKLISFRINKIQDNFIYGIVTNCTLYNDIYNRGSIGFNFSTDKTCMNNDFYRLEKDIIGYNCTKCCIFYNEAQLNFGDKFLCWKCSVPLFQ